MLTSSEGLKNVNDLVTYKTLSLASYPQTYEIKSSGHLNLDWFITHKALNHTCRSFWAYWAAKNWTLQ